jgi:hypothetical protein
MAKIGTGWVIALIAVALFIAVPSVQNAVLGIFKPATTVDPFAGRCLEHSQITMTLGPVVKKYAEGTKPAGVWDRVIIDGVDNGLKADGATMTVSFGQKVTVYYAENDTTYYNNKHEFTVPCAGDFTTASVAKSDESKIVAKVSPTVSVFNMDDGLINTVGTPETMAADDSTILRYRLTVPGTGGVSPYGKIYFTFVANSSFFQDVVLGGEGVAVANPSAYRSQASSTSGFDLYTFSIPGIAGGAASSKEYTLSMTTSSVAAGATTVDSFLDDESFYQHSKSGEMLFGAATDLKADAGFDFGTAYTIYIN